MFEVGDYVVFGTDGVCRVENVGSLDMEGVSKEKTYYTLLPVGKNDNNRIFYPVESKRVVIRKIISRDEAKELINNIKNIACLEIPDERRREETYKAVMQSCDCEGMVSLIKEISCRKQQRSAAGKRLPAVDERYFNMAENSLCSELSLPLELDKTQMKDRIEEAIAMV